MQAAYVYLEPVEAGEAGVDAEIADEAGELVEAVALAVVLVVAAVVAVEVVEAVALQPLHDEFQHQMFCVLKLKKSCKIENHENFVKTKRVKTFIRSKSVKVNRQQQKKSSTTTQRQMFLRSVLKNKKDNFQLTYYARLCSIN